MRRETIEFTLGALGGRTQVHVRLWRAGERWVACADGTSLATGVGGTARQALVAALEPLGRAVLGTMMADLALLEPSCRVIEQQLEPAGA